MIPAAPQLFPAYEPLVETAGIEPARSSRRDAPPRLTTFSLQLRGSGQREEWFVVDGLVVRP